MAPSPPDDHPLEPRGRRAIAFLVFLLALALLVAGLLATELVAKRVLEAGFGPARVPGHYSIGVMSAWVALVLTAFGLCSHVSTAIAPRRRGGVAWGSSEEAQ